MTTEAEIEEKFWKALKSDMTVMLGLVGRDDGHAQPMTAQIEDGGSRSDLVLLGEGRRPGPGHRRGRPRAAALRV